jgi:SAM-dependent methyltransferase
MSRLLFRYWTKFYNLVWECKLGISTRGAVEVSEPDAIDYGTSSYSAIFSILHNLSLEPSDVFVDLGCGKGRVVCCASLFNIREVIGVEVEENLYEIAKHNVARLRGRKAPSTIINTRAQDFDYLKGTVFYLFNPFGSLTLHKVLSKLQLSLYSHPRSVKMVYVNPRHESLLNGSNCLEMYDRWEPGRNMHCVSFWRSKERFSKAG